MNWTSARRPRDLERLAHEALLFTFDVVSPYAYLLSSDFRRCLQGLSYEVSYQPVLLVRLLTHWDHRGPAEIAPKREWTYRQVSGWPPPPPAVANCGSAPVQSAGAVAAGAGHKSRRSYAQPLVCEAVLHHVWRGGADAPIARLTALAQQLSPQRDPQA